VPRQASYLKETKFREGLVSIQRGGRKEAVGETLHSRVEGAAGKKEKTST